MPSLSFGRQPLKIPLSEYRLAVTICFEDTIPQVIARFFREDAAGRQPDVLINLSNDGWFHGSAELDMHLAIGVFRAVEHRVPLARAVNTGLSALVDGNGEIRAFLPKETEGVLSVTVPLDDRRSLYTRLGDWLGLSCLAVTIGLVPLGIFRKPRRAAPAELTETPEIPTLGCLPERRPWGKFGQVGHLGRREPESLTGRFRTRVVAACHSSSRIVNIKIAVEDR